MSILPKNIHNCPFLILAPMEGVGDRCFRKAMATIGGFDEACTEFLRVPSNAHVQSLAKKYIVNETHPIPQAAQIMGSDPELMGSMAYELAKRGAPRIDLNCGCPSNTVTGRGAGSSLLKDPNLLYSIAKAMVKAVDGIPVTAKLRSGFTDTSLFKENILAAEESGISFLTLHPRTKLEGYTPPANWDLIAEAKSILRIPVVGNGDILNVKDALTMVQRTGCDALMIGRGSVINPWIFHQIKSHFSGENFSYRWNSLETYLHTFVNELIIDSSDKGKINKLKQLVSFLFKANEFLLEMKNQVLCDQYLNASDFLNRVTPLLKMGWQKANWI